MLSRELVLSLIAVCAATAASISAAEPAPFDLVGPTLDVRVTRGAASLPITKVPNLAVGDRLIIKARLPDSQSAHYLMVAAFLRGPTNPPPATWFYRCDTWTSACAKQGIDLVVPKDAQQLLVFFAPETGGDFSTLVNAVRGRPGAFVRASQQLAQAALDHGRLDRYLDGLRALDRVDPERLKTGAPLLARSLAIKVDDKCLDRIPALQAPCLMQGQDSLILSDGHSASMVATLTSGPASDLALQAGGTALQGAYSPFIGSILDVGRLLDSFHTAHYQYIPALTSQRDDSLVLMLNTPPSFHDPKSVLVVALPAIEAAQLPPIHAVDAKAVYCSRHFPLVLPIEGAPLVFATGFAHDLALNVKYVDGGTHLLPARADAARGGIVVDAEPPGAAPVDERSRASLQGYWGFDKFDGPMVQLLNPQTQTWTMEASDQASLIVGRENRVHLRSASTGCIADVRMREPDGQESSVPWRPISADELELTLPLQKTKPGPLSLLFRQFGPVEPQSIDLTAFADVGHVDSFSLHAGDAAGLLRGRRLDQVDRLQLNDLDFVPATTPAAVGTDELTMVANDATRAMTWKRGDAGTAVVRLKDGRSVRLDVVVLSPRPRGKLIAKSMRLDPKGQFPNIELASADELPLDSTLTFSVRTESPPAFVRDEAIEIATADNVFSTLLSLGNGGVTLQDSRVALATLEPNKAFGPSAYGALKYRLVIGDTVSDWQPLVTLVRLPSLTHISCPLEPTDACRLAGSKLFLVDSVSSDPKFKSPIRVPDGYPGFSLSVPRPADGRLYIRLRDNPTVVSAIVFPPAPNDGDTNASLPPAGKPVASPAPDRSSSPVRDPGPPK